MIVRYGQNLEIMKFILIRNLRDKIENHNKKPLFIQTVWGVGYKFGE